MASLRWATWLKDGVQTLRSKHLLRQLHPVQQVPDSENPTKVLLSASTMEAWAGQGEAAEDATARGRALACDGKARGEAMFPVTLFSTNDYLGLSGHPDVRQAAAEAAQSYGMGPRGSPLVAGHTSLHRELEVALAKLKGTEECLLFPSGFSANMAVLTALAGSGRTVVLSDELNHASIIDGVRLACVGDAGRRFVYRHGDMGHLEGLLRGVPEGARALVVTDSVFSMDGDVAPLRELVALRERYGFLLCVDEAHATLLYGGRGGGVVEALGLTGGVDVELGTLSKAVGSLGGFACCSGEMRAWLLNRGRAFVYSTAIPVPAVAAALAALEAASPSLRGALWSNVARLAAATGAPPASPILPVVVGGELEALRLSARLLRQGFHVPAIRPPTVPPGTARLRLTVSAAHTREDIDALAQALAEGVGAQAPGE